MKKYLFALCALGALACAQEAKNGASIGVGAPQNAPAAIVLFKFNCFFILKM